MADGWGHSERVSRLLLNWVYASFGRCVYCSECAADLAITIAKRYAGGTHVCVGLVDPAKVVLGDGGCGGLVARGQAGALVALSQAGLSLDAMVRCR